MKLVKIEKAKPYVNNGNRNGPHVPAISAIYGVQNDDGKIIARIVNRRYKTWEVIENGGSFSRIINRPFDSKIEAFEAAKEHFEKEAKT